MKPRALPFLLCATLSLGTAWAADGGAGARARGPYNDANGIYTVVSGDALKSIAARFGTSVTHIEQANHLTSQRVRVGQQLLVGAPAGSGPTDADPRDVAPADTPAAPTTAPTLAPAAPTPQAVAAIPDLAPAPAVPPPPTTPWPRQLRVADRTMVVYQPQVLSWNGNQLDLRAAVAVQPVGGGEQSFGVIEAQALTQVDRVQRLVVLQGLKVTKADFPTVPALAGSLAGTVAQQFGANVRIMPLDQLETALGAEQAAPTTGVTVQNPTPQVIVTYEPAILVAVQGRPVLQAIPDTNLQRVVNTRAVILTESTDGLYYLHLLDGWVTAQTLAGPWVHAAIAPTGMDEAASRLAAAGQADLLNGRPSIPTMQLLAAGIPEVYVAETPAELIVFKGEPDLVPIVGTGLLWATNTSAQVIVDTTDSSNYALLAGRWYRAPALQGPWSFVASSALPADFKQIPVSSPAGRVLAAVAGTPQARAALIANTIPQTAAVPRHGGPTFTPVVDGPARVSLLDGTELEYVVNCETPIVRVGGVTYYALQAGIWFESTTLDGPWAVAATVPAAIYTIPPSSPLHYVTYARVYGSTPEVVYEGYTPGYLGTVATSDGVVVYGTGYGYQPWIGTDWYAAPDTFGLAAQPVHTAGLGYGYGFSLGPVTAAVADSYWGGTSYRSAVTGNGCCTATSANLYSHWGNAIAAGTRHWNDGARGASGGDATAQDTAGTAVPEDGASAIHQTSSDTTRTGETRTVDRPLVSDGFYAGADGKVYRNTGNGWQRHGDAGWQDAGGDTGWADREQLVRAAGTARSSAVRGSAEPVSSDDPGERDVGADRFGGGGFGGRLGGRR